MIYRLSIVFLLFCFSLKGQDIHFSLYDQMPQNLNPALTGVSEATLRAGLIYRNQWNSVTSPFQSSGVFGDYKFSPSFLPNEIFAVGLQFLNDVSGTGGLKENHFTAALNYLKFINGKKNMMVTGGIKLGFFQKSYDPSKLAFETDYLYESNTFVGNGSFENLVNTSVVAPDLGIGATFVHYNRKGQISTAGISATHLTSPNMSFFEDEDPLATKFTVHGRTVREIKSNLHYYPSVLAQYQGKSTELIFGGVFVYGLGRKLIEDTELKAGVYYRVQDALNFVVGINHDNWGINFAYDYNISGLGEAASNVNAFEIGITIRNRLFKPSVDRYIVPGNRLL